MAAISDIAELAFSDVLKRDLGLGCFGFGVVIDACWTTVSNFYAMVMSWA